MKTLFSFVASVLALFVFVPTTVSAHCDTYTGPVVQAAKHSLETGNVNYVLIWVKKDNEDEIKSAFKKTLNVRKLGAEAKELADKSFYETVVRVHRMGEGAPYRGLVEDMDLGPAIPAADSAIKSGNITAVKVLLTAEVSKALERYWHEVLEKKQFDPNDVPKGREFVQSYVEFIHFVERTFNSAYSSPHEGGAEDMHHAE